MSQEVYILLCIRKIMVKRLSMKSPANKILETKPNVGNIILISSLGVHHWTFI